MNIERAILKNLLKNKDYSNKVSPFLKSEYFMSDDDRMLYNVINEFMYKYSTSPSIDAVIVEVNGKKGQKETTVKSVLDTLEKIDKDTEDTNSDWLIEETEKFCLEKALHNVIMKSIEVLDKKDMLVAGSIPQDFIDALGISFDPHVGHDFFEQSDERFKNYHKVDEKLPFDIEWLNKITNGGIPRKTLSVCMAGIGAGKSTILCHLAAANIAAGKSVLYITLELSEEMVAQRLDANLLNISIEDLLLIPESMYQQKMTNLKNKTNGKFIIKQFPGGMKSATDFRALLSELKLKKNFIPDVIYVDYINLCASNRLKISSGSDTYMTVKLAAEEVRAIAVDHNVQIFTATQVNRAGFTDTDFGLENTSESFGLPATADFMWAMIVTEQLEALNQVMFKQLKNRFGDQNKNVRQIVGIDRSKMKLYDADVSAQAGVMKVAQSGSSKQQSQAPKNSSSSAVSNTGKDRFKSLKVN